jgi:hypothetical protein
VLKLGHFGQYVKNILKVLRCGVEEGQRRSVEPRYSLFRDVMQRELIVAA